MVSVLKRFPFWQLSAVSDSNSRGLVATGFSGATFKVLHNPLRQAAREVLKESSGRRNERSDFGAFLGSPNRVAGLIPTFQFSPRGESSIDNKAVPGHEGRFLGAQPEHGFGYFLHPPEPPDRMQWRELFFFILKPSASRSTISVSITAGLTALIRIPFAEYSNAATFVSPMTACFEAI